MDLDKLEDVIDDLCITARLPARPRNVSNFLFYRALGKARSRQASGADVGERNLRYWEEKIEENLSMREEILLVESSVEFQRRIREERGELKDA